MTPICFLDLDGVLVDFMRGALAWHGRALPPREVRYDFWKQLGMSAEEFWSPLDAEFWGGLPWHDEGRRLLDGIEGAFGRRVVVLTLGNANGAAAGKREWLAREAPRLARRAIVCDTPEHKKWHYAGPGSILVDDYDKNVDEFRAAGGEAVLVPRPWNTRGGETDELGRFDVAAVLDDVKRAVYRAAWGPWPATDATLYPLAHPKLTALLPGRKNGKPYTNQQMRKWVRDGLQDVAGNVVKLKAVQGLGNNLSPQWVTTPADVKAFAAAVGRMLKDAA